jgi:hypothetical protein
MGFGRALRHLQMHDAAPYIDEIWDFLVSDCSGNKAWLVDVLEATGQPLEFVKYIGQHLLKGTYRDDENLEWNFAWLLVETTKRSSKGSRRTLDKLFGLRMAEPQNWEFLPIVQILELDGHSGLFAVLEKFGQAIQQQKAGTLPRYLSSRVKDAVRDGINLEQWCEQSANVAAALLQITMTTPPLPIQLAYLPYSTIRAMIQKRKKPSDYQLSLWGQSATLGELRLAARDLLLQRQPQKIRSYLRIFTKRPFPLDFRHLMRFSKHTANQSSIDNHTS